MVGIVLSTNGQDMQNYSNGVGSHRISKKNTKLFQLLIVMGG